MSPDQQRTQPLRTIKQARPTIKDLTHMMVRMLEYLRVMGQRSASKKKMLSKPIPTLDLESSTK